MACSWMEKGRSSSRRKLGQRADRRQSGFPSAAISKASFARAGPNCLQVLKSVLAGTLQESVLKCRRAAEQRDELAAPCMSGKEHCEG